MSLKASELKVGDSRTVVIVASLPWALWNASTSARFT